MTPLLALLLGGAPALAALYECRTAAGESRLSSRPCAAGETPVSERPSRPKAVEPAPPDARETTAEEREPEPETDVPPGLRSDGAGGWLRYPGERWVIHNHLYAHTWSPETGWTRSAPIGEDKRRALKNAVEAFNRIPGLRLQLVYQETDSDEFGWDAARSNRDKFVIYWAEDARVKGALPRPFFWVEKSGSYKGGTVPFLADRDGRPVTSKRSADVRGPVVIRGAAIYSRERIGKPTDLGRCRTDAPYYAQLHELGHALGLTHATPKPSIMSGSCGMEYLPNDVENLKRLYGR